MAKFYVGEFVLLFSDGELDAFDSSGRIWIIDNQIVFLSHISLVLFDLPLPYLLSEDHILSVDDVMPLEGAVYSHIIIFKHAC